jgi:hypothetical protein
MVTVETMTRGLLLACILGCFEVQEVPVDRAGTARPAPLLIDDFEDGDPRPSASNIEPWRCATYSPGPGVQPVACGPVAEGYGSSRGYSLWFALSDARDGVDRFPLAVLFAPITLPMDVSLYEELRFSARYAGDTPLPETAFLEVRLSCFAENEGPPTSLDNAVLLTGVWQRNPLLLANFAQPEWQIEEQSERADAALCATGINALSFGITGFSDGDAATGTLMVDDVYLR